MSIQKRAEGLAQHVRSQDMQKQANKLRILKSLLGSASFPFKRWAKDPMGQKAHALAAEDLKLLRSAKGRAGARHAMDTAPSDPFSPLNIKTTKGSGLTNVDARPEAERAKILAELGKRAETPGKGRLFLGDHPNRQAEILQRQGENALQYAAPETLGKTTRASLRDAAWHDKARKLHSGRAKTQPAGSLLGAGAAGAAGAAAGSQEARGTAKDFAGAAGSQAKAGAKGAVHRAKNLAEKLRF